MRDVQPVVRKRGLRERDTSALEYWLSRPAEERIGMVEQLRAEYYGWSDEPEPRLQRVCRVLRRA